MHCQDNDTFSIMDIKIDAIKKNIYIDFDIYNGKKDPYFLHLLIDI